MNKYETRQRLDKELRKHEDMMKGITRKDIPCRGDYRMCRDADKVIKDYKSFKNPKDRDKIKSEYFQLQREHRRMVT